MNTSSEPAHPRARPLSQKVWQVTRALLIAYGAICLLMIFLETKIVYPAPPSQSKPTAEDFGFEEVHFQSADGTALHGWYHAHPEPRFGLLYCHGNGEDITRNADLVHYFHDELSASVFIFDYRGYGQSAGSPHEAGVIADGLAAQRWLAERLEVETDQLVLVGRSLGGGVAVALAEQQGARALVLQNTFASMVDVAAEKFPWLPIRWMMRNRYPSVERIKAYTGPLLQSHGTADQVIPFSMGKQLFEASPSKQKQFFEILDGSHNGPLPDRYLEALIDFLEHPREPARPQISLRRFVTGRVRRFVCRLASRRLAPTFTHHIRGKRRHRKPQHIPLRNALFERRLSETNGPRPALILERNNRLRRFGRFFPLRIRFL